MIEIKNLSKRYGDKVALNNVSFTVNQGEILGFLGPNGAGKSTTMNIITGYLSASAGSVTIDGFDILDNPIQAKKRIGYLPEQPPLYMDMTVNEYLDFMYDLKRVKVGASKKNHITAICELVKIADVRTRMIRNLSKGYKQRVGIAQALLGNPEVLILDEPTVGLDPKQIIEIRELIKNLSESHTVILSSHILPEIQAVCDRVIVVNRGTLVADDTEANLSKKFSDDHCFTLRVDGPEAEVLSTLRAIPFMKDVKSLGQKEAGVIEYRYETEEGQDARREVFKRLSGRNWAIMGLRSNEMSLEDIFLHLTGDNAVVPVADEVKEGEKNVAVTLDNLLEQSFDSIEEGVEEVDSATAEATRIAETDDVVAEATPVEENDDAHDTDKKDGGEE